ncbi:MAG: epoxyqueuosine reductase QueH [Bacillota bacterium]
MLPYITTFIAISIISFLVGRGVISVAERFHIVDSPDGVRKLQSKPIPLLGGTAIFISFFTGLAVFLPTLLSGDLDISHWIGFFAGASVLMLGGFLDDKYDLNPRIQIIFPIIASIAPIIGGVGIERLSNPFGGIFAVPALLSAALIMVWLLGMMYTTKLLDGVDGLVSGLGVIGALVIFLFTSTTRYFQPDIALAAWIFSAACLGFLVLNFNPAKIYLGEGGSLLIGYVLGVLAIISGGKIAIALLVMGLPVLDVAWTIVRRLLRGRNPFRFADRSHLHHRLLDLGLSPRQTVVIFYAFAAAFGASGLFLQSRGKLVALSLLLAIMLALVIFFSQYERRKRPRLLFHVCCAPCASYSTLKKLLPRYRVTWYFLNSNLSSFLEYEARLKTAEKAARLLGVELIAVPYDHEAWSEIVKGHEDDPERGDRCRICYRDRLSNAYKFAQDGGYEFFSTSLLVSPYKDDKAIREICRSLEKEGGPKFHDEDFQADDGFHRSIAWAKEKGLYLQKYCGCEFSLRK